MFTLFHMIIVHYVFPIYILKLELTCFAFSNIFRIKSFENSFTLIALIQFLQQFVNKLRYAKEGAKDIVDRTCADLPWQVWLEVDGKDIHIPKVHYS